MKNQKTVKVGVVGVGHLGRLHVMQLKEVAEAELIGLYDLDTRRAQEVGAEFEIAVYSDFQELLNKVDALTIVTPTTTHYQYACQALQEKRHIFIEKPITTTLEEAGEIIRLSREQHLKVQVGHIERFNPAIMNLKPLQINPFFIEAHRMANFNPRGTDVAVVMDLMIHDIDLILSFVNSPVKGVSASGGSIISTTEDIANCRLQFENGCVANVTASRISSRKMRKMRFFEPNAYISVDFLTGISDVFYLDGKDFPFSGEKSEALLGEIEKGTERREIRYAQVQKADLNPLRYELQLFCRAILEDQVPPVTAEEGCRALRVANQILECIDEHTKLIRKNWSL